MRKIIIKDKPTWKKDGQYTFLNDNDTEYSASNSIPEINDKFADKDLYTVVQDSTLNDYIVKYGLPFVSDSFLKINSLSLSNNGVTGGVVNGYTAVYILDNYAYVNLAGAGSNILTDDYDTIQSALVREVRAYAWGLGTFGEGENPGKVLEEYKVLQNLNGAYSNMNADAEYRTALWYYDPQTAFQDPTLGGSGNNKIIAKNGSQKIYVIVKTHGDKDEWWIFNDPRKDKYHIWSINAVELYDTDGMGKVTEGGILDFTYSDMIRTVEGGGGDLGLSWYNAEKPAFKVDNIRLSINTLSGLSQESQDQLPSHVVDSLVSVSPPLYMDNDKFEETFIGQHPSRQVSNLIFPLNNQIYIDDWYLDHLFPELFDPGDILAWGMTRNDKLNQIQKNFQPVPIIKIKDDDRYNLQVFQTSSIDKQNCSAPNQVSLDFYLSTDYKTRLVEYDKTINISNISTNNHHEEIFLEPLMDLIEIEKVTSFYQGDGSLNAWMEFDVELTNPDCHINQIEMTVPGTAQDIPTSGNGQGSEAGTGFWRIIRTQDVNDGNGWQIGDNKVKADCFNGAYTEYYQEGNISPTQDYSGSYLFNRIEIHTQFNNFSAGDSANITVTNFKIFDYDYIDSDDISILENNNDNHVGTKNKQGWLGCKYFVIDWDDKDNKFDKIEDFIQDFPRDLGELYKKQSNNLYRFSDIEVDRLGIEGTRKEPLTHTYLTPGIKTIKSILFTHTRIPRGVKELELKASRGYLQPVRWKFITSRIFLDIPENQYPDFEDLGGSKFSTLPWPYTTAIIGGVDDTSKYNISVDNTLRGGKIGNQDIIDEVFLENTKRNDELGKSVDIDLEQVRFFNTGSYDMSTLLGIRPETENTLFSNNLYWDCADWNTNRLRCFSEETSVGEIFINENIDNDLINNCKIELNCGYEYKKFIDDTGNQANKGMLIGDYKINKRKKGIKMQRNSFIKVPKKSKKDGAL